MNSLQSLKRWLVVCLVFQCFSCYGQKQNPYLNTFKQKQIGILVHYLNTLQNTTLPWNQGKTTTWDNCVNDFDAEKFAQGVKQTGAGYVIFTIQQNQEFFCAPNKTFEQRSALARGQATTHRDLIDDIYKSLQLRKIDLFLYSSANGPIQNFPLMVKLTNNNFHQRVVNNAYQVDKNFVQVWSSILEEYSRRYTTKIKGWWIDGAYKFIGYNDTLLAIMRKALKSGNSNAIVAFNPSPKDTVTYYTPLDDYTAGEIYHINSRPKQRFLSNTQWHAVTFLGRDWGANDIRFSKKDFSTYIQDCNDKGGVVTVDICIYRDGSLDKKQVQFLSSVIKDIKHR